jgi:phage-related protein
MKRLTFDWIRRPDGTSEFREYMDSLPPKDRAKLSAVIAKTEDNGMEIAKKAKWVKKLRDGIFELRSKQGNNIQRALYFHEHGTKHVVTHGFTKKTDEVPLREIEHSRKLRDEYLRGKGR